jgi:hypothetical protein
MMLRAILGWRSQFRDRFQMNLDGQWTTPIGRILFRGIAAMARLRMWVIRDNDGFFLTGAASTIRSCASPKVISGPA